VQNTIANVRHLNYTSMGGVGYIFLVLNAILLFWPGFLDSKISVGYHYYSYLFIVIYLFVNILLISNVLVQKKYLIIGLEKPLFCLLIVQILSLYINTVILNRGYISMSAGIIIYTSLSITYVITFVNLHNKIGNVYSFAWGLYLLSAALGALSVITLVYNEWFVNVFGLPYFKEGRSITLVHHENVLPAFVPIGVYFSLFSQSKAKKILSLLLLLTICMGVIASGSRAAVIASVVVTLFYVRRLIKKVNVSSKIGVFVTAIIAIPILSVVFYDTDAYRRVTATIPIDVVHLCGD